MIQPNIDFTGQLSPAENEAYDLDSVEEELARQKDQVTLLTTMDILQYDDATLNSTPESSILGPGYRLDPGNLATIPHNADYVPQFLAFQVLAFDDGTGNIVKEYFKLPQRNFLLPGRSTVTLNWRVSVDEANLYVDFEAPFAISFTGLGVPTVRYYIFAQPASNQ